MLNTLQFGDPDAGPPLIIAHGLFGSARNWGVIAKRLSDARRVIAVDMRNHGASGWTERHDYPEMAADLAEVIADAGGRADVLGHSMGGKAAMMLALDHPARVRSLIVADIAPVRYLHSQLPLIEAMRSLPEGTASRAEAERALAVEIEDPALRAFLLQSFDPRGGGWRLNLEALERDMPQIMGFPPTDSHFTGPCLFMTGQNSSYVQPAHRDRIKALFPGARFATLNGAGHWLHAEKPREVEAVVRAFLAAVAAAEGQD